MDLYSIGEMVIDFTPGREPNSYVRNPGGAPANAAIAAARNGLSVGMCTSVGEDDFGRFLLATLKENNVRVLNPELCREAVTTMAFVSLKPDGDRSFTFARKPGADMFLSEAHVKESDIAESAIVHAGSCSLSASPAKEATIRAMRLGHEQGKLVSFDLNYRDVMWPTGPGACGAAVREVLPLVDLLKISADEAFLLGGGEALPQVMEEYNIAVAVETLGGDGVLALYGGQSARIPARQVKCLDATGAGDAFWGGFLSSLRIAGVGALGQLTFDLVRKAAVYGNVAAGLCVQGWGGIPALPTRAQIESWLGDE